MSKKLIAGAGVVASFAIALAPLATFATDNAIMEQTDTLRLTLNATCSIAATSGVAHASGTGTWNGNILAATVAPFTDTFTVTYAAGISDSLAAGIYEGDVEYTLTPSAHTGA